MSSSTWWSPPFSPRTNICFLSSVHVPVFVSLISWLHFTLSMLCWQDQQMHWAMQLHNELQRQGRLRGLSWNDQISGPGHQATWTSTVFSEWRPWLLGRNWLIFVALCRPSTLHVTCVHPDDSRWDRVWDRKRNHETRSTRRSRQKSLNPLNRRNGIDCEYQVVL